MGTPPSQCGWFSESISVSGYGVFLLGVSPESCQPNQAAHLFSETFSQLPELTALILKDRAGPVDLASFTGSLVRSPRLVLLTSDPSGKLRGHRYGFSGQSHPFLLVRKWSDFFFSGSLFDTVRVVR